MITQELTKWELGANYPYVPIMTRAAETGQILNSVMDSTQLLCPDVFTTICYGRGKYRIHILR